MSLWTRICRQTTGAWVYPAAYTLWVLLAVGGIATTLHAG